MGPRSAVGLLSFGVLVTLMSVAISRSETPRPVPKVPVGWKFQLPEGDAESGREVFLRMECSACHKLEIPGMDLPKGGAMSPT